MVRVYRAACWVQVGALGLIALSTFGRWARSGRRWRNSYELFGVAERLGVTSRFVSDLMRLWVLVPAAIGAALVAFAFGHPRLGAALGFVIGVTAVGCSLAVRARPLRVGIGTTFTLVGGILAVVTGLAVTLAPRRMEVRP